METKDKKIQVHTIDNKDIDKFFVVLGSFVHPSEKTTSMQQ